MHQDPVVALAADPRALLIDVRTADEVAGGVVQGAVHVPMGEEARMATLIGEKDRPVIVYCRSGNRSGNSRMALVRMGFTNVLNGGGFADLAQRLGRPLVRP